ncbi:hypothetical protein N7517_000008 [Penicillium concentricum]|uniref:Uncharacterized protein n=1 Tax=Penicillium concentricum TaxID=293559 RepID=A0A9W9SPH9_9EURO|nr:uncharacterized protein N7517_000008 [Penicillium concentricum]KAJ5382097.1 hypothetical protein N7517_000008 [Penicillium concentricum]
MDLLHVIALFSFFFTAVVAFPQQTAVITTTATPATITKAASLSCSDGKTAVYTTDCTMGTPTSYCASPEPPIQCSEGYFPSVWHPGHCMEQSTCFPLDASWITTECSHGAVPWTTSTLYEGTLAGGQSTIISGQSFHLPFPCSIRPLVYALPKRINCGYFLYALKFLPSWHDNLGLNQYVLRNGAGKRVLRYSPRNKLLQVRICSADTCISRLCWGGSNRM